MKSFEFKIDEREALYGRLVSDVLTTLQEAVQHRINQGATRAQIAERIGCARSQLSRTLNGHVPNLTVRTIADILWASEFEPCEFSAEPIEHIAPNRQCTLIPYDTKQVHTKTADVRGDTSYRIYHVIHANASRQAQLYETTA